MKVTSNEYDCPKILGVESERLLCAHSWPGNVRELRNAIERAMILVNGESVINPCHLPMLQNEVTGSPLEIERHDQSPASPEVDDIDRLIAKVAALSDNRTFPDLMKLIERAMIERGLWKHNGNRSSLARALDISVRTLRERIKGYGI